MGIQFPPSTATSGPVVTTTSPNVTASTVLLAADLNRVSGTIYNLTNRTIGVAFNATPATLASPSKLIPANGNMDLYEFYTGAIQVIGTAGATGTIVVDTVSNL